MDNDTTAILGVLFLIGLVAAWLRERAKTERPWLENQHKNQMDLPQPQYWPADPYGKQECVIDAAALVEQRRESGRHLGGNVYVYWRPGVDWEIDNHGLWIEQHGPANGVFVTRTSDAKPLANPGVECGISLAQNKVFGLVGKSPKTFFVNF